MKIDNNLVYLRLENARMRLKEISSLLNKSSQRLKYSLNNLEKESILINPHCVFDYSYFGILLFRVYFKGGYISEKDRKNIIEQLSDDPYIVSIYELEGEFDLIMEFACPNPSKFNKELKKIATLIPTLNHYKIVLNVVTHLYPKYYLTKDSNLTILNNVHIIGGDRDVKEFNKNEMSVIKNILLNPKIRVTELANKSGINVKTANSILKNLKKNKVIRGFKYALDTNKLKINKFRLFIELHNLSPEKEKQIVDHMLKIEEIVQLNKTVGDWDMEVDIESFDKEKVRSIVMRLREEFKEIIQGFNIIEFYKYHKKSYLPLYLFE